MSFVILCISIALFQMVDSIIFRIHDLELHYTLCEYLQKLGSGISQEVKSLDVSESPLREIHMRRYFTDAATGRTWKEKYRDFIKSHHYHIAYSIDFDKNFMEFNLSLPKYHFGNNVFQLVDHQDEANYLYYRNTEFWDCTRLAFDKFISVLRKFVTKELGGYYDKATGTGVVHRPYIEIMRLDLCYNLVFNTESDAQFYLSQISTIKKRGLRTSNAGVFQKTRQRNYGDDLYFSSKDFTVKVYQKGTEFKKHDYSKVVKRFGKKIADELHHRARRMLRYEVEFRPGYLTELFITNLKETNPQIYKCVSLSRAYSKNTYVIFDGVRYSFDGIDVKGMKCAKMTSGIKQMIAVGDWIRKRNFHFMGSLNSSYSLDMAGLDDVVNSYEYKEAFSFELFDLMVKSFKNHFMRFQLGSFNSLAVLNNVVNQNKEADFQKHVNIMTGKSVNEYKVSRRIVYQFLDLLRDHSWDQIKKMGHFSDRNFYRYKKFFKDCGLIAQRSHEYDFKVKYDYANYYDLIAELYYYLTVTPII